MTGGKRTSRRTESVRVTYEQARAAFDSLAVAERADDRIDPLGYSRLMDRGSRAERAIAFYHGFTNCPQQFVELGQRFFDAGYNVYIPRLPGHGMRDKMTTSLAQVTRDDLTRAAAQAADMAAGLGSRAHVAGISLGGVLAAWAGENQPLAGATAISPFMGVRNLPGWANSLLAGTLSLLPNFYLWWDPRVGANNPATPPYAYARYPTHALAAQLQIAARIKSLPRAQGSGLFVNAHDPAVNNRISESLYDRWQKRGARTVREILDAGKLPHDIIDNFAGKLPVDRIYPAILDMVARVDALSE